MSTIHTLHTLKIIRPSQLLSYYVTFRGNSADTSITCALRRDSSGEPLPGSVATRSGVAGQHRLDAKVITQLAVGEKVSLIVEADLDKQIVIESWGLFQ